MEDYKKSKTHKVTSDTTKTTTTNVVVELEVMDKKKDDTIQVSGKPGQKKTEKKKKVGQPKEDELDAMKIINKKIESDLSKDSNKEKAYVMKRMQEKKNQDS